MEQKVIVELKNIRKEFPGVVALDEVNMQIKTGSIHALVGENGAGKSTLMKILSGTYENYDGEILYEGTRVHFNSEKDALNKGISIVSQELNCVPELTIAENLFLGREPTTIYGFVDRKLRRKKTKELLEYMDLDFDPDTKMGSLSIAKKQLIEILKAISRNSKVIIMDEPTSALTNIEAEMLFTKIKELQKKMIAFVFISHRLEEVFKLCDEYTVLRDGKYIGSGYIKDVDKDKLISMMVGREVKNIYPPISPPKSRVVFKAEKLSCDTVFQDISFEIKEGEILGFAGMMGAGRSEIAGSIFGMHPKDKGEIYLEGQKCRIKTTSDAIKAGIAMVTEDRASYGFVGVRSIKENIVLPNNDIFSKRGWLLKSKIKTRVEDIFQKLSIKAPGIETQVNNLSGGNQQKVVLSKWLVRNVKLLIMDEPTRGIDVGAKQEIYNLISDLASQGIAILLISSDMPEVLSMSHRVVVIANGKKAGELTREEFSQDKVMKMIVEVDSHNEE